MNKFKDTRNNFQKVRKTKSQIKIFNFEFLIFCILYLGALNFLSAGRAHAQTLKDLDPTFVKDMPVDPSQGTVGWSYLMSNLLGRAPYYLGGLALLALIYSGALYVMSYGDPTKMETAKKNITWTVIGILAIVSMFAVIGVISWLANPAQ